MPDEVTDTPVVEGRVMWTNRILTAILGVVVSQTLAAIWWASSMNTSMGYVLKNQEASNGTIGALVTKSAEFDSQFRVINATLVPEVAALKAQVAINTVNNSATSTRITALESKVK